MSNTSAAPTRRRSRLARSGDHIGLVGGVLLAATVSDSDWLMGPGANRTLLEIEEFNKADLHGAAEFYFRGGGLIVIAVALALGVIARFVSRRHLLAYRVAAVVAAACGAATCLVLTHEIAGLGGMAQDLGPGVYLHATGFTLLAAAVLFPVDTVTNSVSGAPA